VLLPFTEDLVLTSAADAEMAILPDRHYSRLRRGRRQFLYAGRKLVIRNSAGTILFGWSWELEGMRMDEQRDYCCSIFRNESSPLSSDVILEAERIARQHWGPGRMFTYVDPAKIRSVNPGYCFKVAGWHFVHRTRDGKHLLVKERAA